MAKIHEYHLTDEDVEMLKYCIGIAYGESTINPMNTTYLDQILDNPVTIYEQLEY